jgi:hypothetical protein
MSSWQNADTRRRRVAALSVAMTHSAEKRRCPSCGRGAALKREVIDDYQTVTYCRWKLEGKCDYERSFFADGA